VLEDRDRPHRAGPGRAGHQLADQAPVDLVGLLVDLADALAPGGGPAHRHCRAGVAVRRRGSQRQPAVAAGGVDDLDPGRRDSRQPAEPGDGVADRPRALHRGGRHDQCRAGIAPEPGRDQRRLGERQPGRLHRGARPARRAEHVALDELTGVAVRDLGGLRRRRWGRRRGCRIGNARGDQRARRAGGESRAQCDSDRGDEPGPAHEADRPEPKRECLHRA
jgi:hypothetical protein